MQNVEVISDRPYFEADTVKISVFNTVHQGKFWKHSHEFFEFVYVVEGCALHSYNDATSILADGDLFAIFPGNGHSYIAAHNSKIYNVLFFIDALDSLGDAGRELRSLLYSIGNGDGGDGSVLPIINVGLKERRGIIELLRAMELERNEKKVGWQLNLRAMLVQFIVLCARLIQEGRARNVSDLRGYSKYICDAIKFVQNGYMNDITASDIAAAAGVSADYLAKRFRTAMSMSPVEYLRRYRIAVSMDMLKDTDMSISDVAKAAGFGDVSIFSRVFRQTVGVSPAAFRKE